MPTASQCQVINNIVRRESLQNFGPYISGETTSSDETSDGTGGGAQAIASAASETTRPTLNVINEGVPSPIVQRRPSTSVYRGRRTAMSPVPTQESVYDDAANSTQVGWGQRRSVIGSRAKSANPRWTRLLERHYEITTFQKQCMDNVERSISGTAKEEVDDFAHDRGIRARSAKEEVCESAHDRGTRARSAKEEVVESAHDRGTTGARSAKEEVVESAHDREIHEQEVRTLDANDERAAAVESPVVRFKSTVKVFEKTNTFSNDTTDANLEIQTPEVTEALASTEEDVNLASATNEVEVPLNDVLPENVDPFPITMFGSRLTDEVKTRLYELGWRKPVKRSKKKKKK